MLDAAEKPLGSSGGFREGIWARPGGSGRRLEGSWGCLGKSGGCLARVLVSPYSPSGLGTTPPLNAAPSQSDLKPLLT